MSMHKTEKHQRGAALSWKQRWLPTVPRILLTFLADSPRFVPHAPFREAAALDVRKDGIRSIRLPESDVASLRAATKGHGMTLHALLYGCILAAQQEVFGLKPGTRYECFSSVSLRKRMEPAVSLDSLGTCISDITHRSPMNEDRDPLRYARAVAEDLTNVADGAFRTQPTCRGGSF